MQIRITLFIRNGRNKQQTTNPSMPGEPRPTLCKGRRQIDLPADRSKPGVHKATKVSTQASRMLCVLVSHRFLGKTSNCCGRRFCAARFAQASRSGGLSPKCTSMLDFVRSPVKSGSSAARLALLRLLGGEKYVEYKCSVLHAAVSAAGRLGVVCCCADSEHALQALPECRRGPFDFHG